MQLINYEVSIFNEIPSLGESLHHTHKLGPGSTFIKGAIRDLFLKHRVQDRFNFRIAHTHFKLREAEKLVHYDAIAMPWDIKAIEPALCERLVPVSWHFTSTGIVPNEFKFQKPDESLAPQIDMIRDGEFLEDLNRLLKERNLVKYFGISSALGPRGGLVPVEITRGRTNVTYPFRLSNATTSMQVSWRFAADDDEDKACCDQECSKDGDSHLDYHHEIDC